MLQGRQSLIDGQALLLLLLLLLLLRGNLQKEISEPMNLMDPEAGDGIRYGFSKNLRLKPGTHRIVVALPDDGIAVEREISLNEGDLNQLAVEPVYSSAPVKKRPGISTTSFKQGIRSLRLNLYGRDL